MAVAGLNVFGWGGLAQMQSASSIRDIHDTWPSAAQVARTLFFQAGYNTNLVIAGTTLLGLAAGVIGVFALLRKRSLTTDALSHATLPGIGIAFLVAGGLGMDGRSLPILLLGAAVSGVVGVLCIQFILRHTRLHEDAAIGIVLSVFFGAGIVTLSYIQNDASGSAAGLNSLIYGQAATMQRLDVVLMGGIAICAIIATACLLKEFTLVCFNDAFAKVDGWPVSLIDLLMMAMVVLVTVAGLQAVGLILVVAMLIIPPVAARFWTERLWLLVVLAGLIGALSGYFGSAVSALFPRKPAGAVIVLTAGTFFAMSMIAAPARGVVASNFRRFSLRLRIAGDHILELAHLQDEARVSAEQFKELGDLRGWPAWLRPIIIWTLRRAGRVAGRESGAIVLTKVGLQRGARVARNHALWEQYLISYADIAPSHVDWSVDQVEHVLSDRLVEELETRLAARGISITARSEIPS